MFQTSKLALVPALLIALPMAVGCGSSRMATQDVASAQSAVRGAVEAGAENEPQAALYLKVARDEIKQARAANNAGNEEAAARLLARAELDAELAIALARKARAIESAREAQDRVSALGEPEAP